jgi:hypothetical protein
MDTTGFYQYHYHQGRLKTIVQWKGRQETTSSSESGLHLGHYIAECESDHLSHFHSIKSSLVIKKGLVLDQWARGLSVMLKKTAGCALITRLRSILLMEADFNATTKIIYRHCVLQIAQGFQLIPEEVEQIASPTMGLLSKYYFMTVPVKLGFLQTSALLTPINDMIVSCTQLY